MLGFLQRHWWVNVDMFGDHYVGKSRLAMNSRNYSFDLTIDGPFDSQEDAARALAFWRRQSPGAMERLYSYR